MRRPSSRLPPGRAAATARGLREASGRHTKYAESALLLYARLLRSRTPEGWQVIDHLARGLTQKDTAVKLGVTPSACLLYTSPSPRD